jgi:hypothetical protein
MLHDFIRKMALKDSELATAWKATYQGFSDDIVSASIKAFLKIFAFSSRFFKTNALFLYSHSLGVHTSVSCFL